MTAHLSEGEARERQAEILGAFLEMIDRGAADGVAAVLIAGDLTDAGKMRPATRRAFLDACRKHPEVRFFLLRGNHDAGLALGADLPENLMAFGPSWRTVSAAAPEESGVRITAAEIPEGEERETIDALRLDKRAINIVMCHGQQAEYYGGPGTIPLDRMRDIGIDYLALGHVHAHEAGRLDGRGIWCCPGCLVGRGFDECGDHGYMLLDIDEEAHAIRSTFVPWAKSRFFEIPVDVTGLSTSPEIAGRMREVLGRAGLKEQDFLRVILTGAVDVEAEINPVYLRSALTSECHFALLRDDTVPRVDYGVYRNDASFRGEFVRSVERDESLTEEQKAEVIRCGLEALSL